MNLSHEKNHLKLITTILLIITIPISTLTALPKFGNRIVTKTRQQLDNIILQATYLEKATLVESRNFIISRSIELDDQTLDPSKKGVSITIITPPPLPINPLIPEEAPPLITYTARNVSITTAITEFAKKSKHDLYITSAGIVFTPPGIPPFPNKLAKKGEIWDTLHKHKKAEKNQTKQEQKQ
ncbi:MAG: hypothetical protein ACSHX6_15185 [Akkermansiaceae bacterium]